ncbi:hypothetical protein RHGRI_036807 [Rhododendron griersonianum]|uniref:Uncharacterized protein n=1 Tax=Rhododendron griersonianum TaxID=479676 RepID=A0AAV6HTM8_9ERIC|nr:hypothetical protein RHGRI_036807 [Rhododendron griersonianum]
MVGVVLKEIIGVAAMMPPYGVRRGFTAGSSGSRYESRVYVDLCRRRYLVISDYLVVIADKCQCLERRLGFHLLLFIPLGSPKCFGVQGIFLFVSLPQIAILLPFLLCV